MKGENVGRVKNKVALITGGVSGLGQASAIRLGEEGATVMISDLQDPLSGEALDSIRASGAEADYFHHDSTDEAAWETITEAILERYGRLDVVVNSAGVRGGGGPLHELTLAQWRRTNAVNLDGVFLGVKHGILAMLKAGNGGSIINLSSILGIVGLPNSSDYSASKGGVRLLTKAAALECAARGDGIRVNSIHPGFIDTPMVQGAIQHRGAELRENIEKMQPTGQMGEAVDIAEGVVFLASDEAKFVTGSELVIDGGFTAR